MLVIQIALGIVLGFTLLALLSYILSATGTVLNRTGTMLARLPALLAAIFRVILIVVLVGAIILAVSYPLSKLFSLLPSNMHHGFVYIVLIGLLGFAIAVVIRYTVKLTRKCLEWARQR
jgi:hypothetical protein